MCGICGQFNFGDSAPVLRDNLELMTRSLVHRGPDDEGYYLSGPLGLGFRRLSIIDLERGHQPMSDQEDSVWVVFNGEIYNFLELRRELEGFGHVFRTACDTEVIIHGYKQWGDELLNRLNGMFGLAIWDVQRRRLIVARDPFGIKLVYYKVDTGKLYFGSEMRPILALTGGRSQIDPNSVSLFLRYRYTPSPHTIHKDVHKLAPGTMLICENGVCNIRRWYKYEPKPFSPMKSAANACEELIDVYKRAIKRHLLSDVPVGLLLSGGLDSGLLLALMNLYGSSWSTYTVGYGSTFSDDELADAAETAAWFSSRHTSVLLDQRSFHDSLPGIVAHLEEPIASSSIVPMYFVCRRARQDVKVALMGQGPDELFGGYRRHLGIRYGRVWREVPDWARHIGGAVIRALPRNETLKRALYSLDLPDRLSRYQNVLSLLPDNQVHGLFQDGVIDSNAGDTILRSWRELVELSASADELGGFQYLELRSTLPDELLMYADKLSMAHGLEVRVPFLDKEVVEYGERLASDFKVRHGVRKWLHRKVCRHFVPNELLNRKKRGFAVNVVDAWFRSAVDTTLSHTLLDREAHIYRYLRFSAVQDLIKQHRSGRGDHHKILFSLIVLEQWHRVHQTDLSSSGSSDSPSALVEFPVHC
ncbi:MAG: asparagine synthase (glutamine-hydrolyzing) [Bryobacteraceae bacterium]